MHEIVSEYGQWEVQREEFTLSEGGKAIVEYNSNDIVERKEKQNALFSPQLKKSEPYIFRRKKKGKNMEGYDESYLQPDFPLVLFVDS